MAGSVLIKHFKLAFLVLLFVSVASTYKKKGGSSDRDRCKNDVARCYSGGNIPCRDRVGGRIKCIYSFQICDNIRDCPWGEDEYYCGFQDFPGVNKFFTLTVTSTTTTTVSTTSTSTMSSVLTSTSTLTSSLTSSSTMITTITPTFTMTPSSQMTTSVFTGTFTGVTTAVSLVNGQVISGGSTCTLSIAPNGLMANANDGLVVVTSAVVTNVVSFTATCSAFTSTITV